MSGDGPEKAFTPYTDMSPTSESVIEEHIGEHVFEEEHRLLQEKDALWLSDEEGREMPPEVKRPSKLVFWIITNIVATISIVFINKAIFSDPMLKGAQLSFAAFHFFITFITLHIASLPQISMFERVTIRFRDLLPLGASMSCNVVLVNLSLAFSSVPFYQATRVLLTPAVAALNFILYQTTIPRQAAMTLIPTCSGIGLMTYFDVKPHASTASTPSSQTSILGAIFAFSALFSSSIYTVLISHYHSKLKLSSMQLLHQQALMSGVLLLYGIPFLDTLPQFSDISSAKWTLILLSGACASIINLSQFTIIAGAGPVASTVVGHSKTVLIVTIGWIASGKSAAGDKNSIVGIVIAIAGIVAYSVVMMRHKAR